MAEEMKIDRDSKQFSEAILRDLHKAFDCICYDLLIVKLDLLQRESFEIYL